MWANAKCGRRKQKANSHYLKVRLRHGGLPTTFSQVDGGAYFVQRRGFCFSLLVCSHFMASESSQNAEVKYLHDYDCTR